MELTEIDLINEIISSYFNGRISLLHRGGTGPIPVEDTMICGIYAIINTYNYKTYIGQSKNILERFKKHFTRLRRNIHENHHLQNSFNKYGEECFSISILMECCESELTVNEQLWIDSFNSDELYNICYIAGSTHGYKHSLESKIKISVASKGNKAALGSKHSDKAKQLISQSLSGRVVSEETRYRQAASTGKKIQQIDIATGKIISEFVSIGQAAKKLNLCHKGVSKVCHGKMKKCGGYGWRFVS
jgi:group I intron endonuclease